VPLVRFVDLSTRIQHSPDGTPEFQRTEIAYNDHGHGAEQIETLFGVTRDQLRDQEGWATEEFRRFGTHNSTHVDAPWHYNSRIQGKPAQTIDELPLRWFFGPGVVLDFTAKGDGEAVTAEEAEAELARTRHDLQPLDVVLVRTGRDQFYDQPDYIARGPGVSAAATKWLWERGVRVMGIDAWGWDAPLHLQAAEAKAHGEPGVFWEAHQADLPYSQIERLVNLHQLPATGFTVACFPLKIARASAAPARVVAILDGEE
jgi:kynurenine formamidase